MSQERINDLIIFVKEWEEALTSVTSIRDKLFQDKQKGFTLLDENGNDVLDDRINVVDRAVIQHQEILIRMTSLRDRTINGENV